MKSFNLRSWILLIVLCLTTQTALANDLDLISGARYLDEHDWPGVSAQPRLGLSLHIRPDGWPVGVVGAFSLSSVRQDHELAINPTYGPNVYEIEGRTCETRLGLRYDFENDQQNQLYLKGGLSLIAARQEYATVTAMEASSRDRAPGLWLGLGASHRLAEHFNLGLETGYNWSQARLWHSDIEAGGFELGIVTGYHW